MKEIRNVSSPSENPRCCQVEEISACQLFTLDSSVLGESNLSLSPLFDGDFILVGNVDRNKDAFYYRKNSTGTEK